MSLAKDTIRAAVGERPERGHILGRRKMDLVMTAVSVWVLAGVYLDGWAHNNIPNLIDTFFTPWHVVLYSGVTAVGLFLGTVGFLNLLRGKHWRQALPQGYPLAFLGVALFALAGAGDLVWHTLFGFEEDVEALLSPSHLALAAGAVLFLAGPFRSAWRRQAADRRANWSAQLPALLAVFTVLSIFTFMTQFANAFGHPNMFVGSGPGGESYFWDVTLIASVLIPAGLLMTFVLLLIRRWDPPAGSLTLLIAGNAAIMFVMNWDRARAHWPILVAALAGGVLADALFVFLKPRLDRTRELRLFAFTVPFALFLLYFVSLLLAGGVWWSVHMWLGAPFLAGIIGLGLSYLLAPPAIPEA